MFFRAEPVKTGLQARVTQPMRIAARSSSSVGSSSSSTFSSSVSS